MHDIFYSFIVISIKINIYYNNSNTGMYNMYVCIKIILRMYQKIVFEGNEILNAGYV